VIGLWWRKEKTLDVLAFFLRFELSNTCGAVLLQKQSKLRRRYG
jgi:hypothetical protein